MTKTKTTEQLQTEAATLAERSQAVLGELNRQQSETAQRRAEGEREFDRELVAGYNRRQLDAEAEEARRALDQRLDADPLLNIVADYLAALRRRQFRVMEAVAAQGRLGRDTSGAQLPAADLGPLQDLLGPVVQRLADQRIAPERAEFFSQREAAATRAEKEETPS